MGTLQAPSGAEMRSSAGDAVINAAASIDVSPIKQRFDAFKKIHTAYVAAQKKVKGAEKPLLARQQLNGELDAAQDEAVQALVEALAKDGFPRLNPLAGFSVYSASKLVELGYAREAKEVHAVVKKVVAKKGVSKGSLNAAKALEATATQLEASLEKEKPLQQAYEAARIRRDALVPAWEAAFAKLKHGAVTADEEGAAGVYEALFGTTARPKRKKKV